MQSLLRRLSLSRMHSFHQNQSPLTNELVARNVAIPQGRLRPSPVHSKGTGDLELPGPARAVTRLRSTAAMSPRVLAVCHQGQLVPKVLAVLERSEVS